jgi:hypothetical protein
MRIFSGSRRWFVALLVLLSACTGTPSRTGFYDSPLLPGDEVEILREIVVPAERARVYLQHGSITGYAGSDQYAPFCYFLLRDPLPVEQVISPGVLTVEKVWLNQTSVALDAPVRLASALSFGGGNQSVMAWQFHITLQTASQARMILVCSGAFDVPATAEPIRLPEVREALGDYAEVRVTETGQ